MRLAIPVLILMAMSVPAFAAEDKAAFPPFDSSTFAGQLFWLVITFGGLYLLMSRIALPRIGGVIEERRATIDGALRAANAAQKSAEEAAVALEQGLTKARSNAQAIAMEARAKSAKEVDARRAGVEADLKGKLSAAEARIGETKAKAMGNVDDIAKDAVEAIIEQLTGKAPAADALAKAIGAARGN